MNRIPIRLRLSLLTSLLGVGIVLVVGLVGYAHTADELRDGTDQSLREELAEIVPVVVDPQRSLRSHRVDSDDGGLEVAQLLDTDGVVIDATPGAEDLDLLGAADDREGPSTITLPTVDFPVRTMIAPVSVDGVQLTMTVGRSVEGTDATLADLRRRIALLGGVAVAFLFTATYTIASLSLRPVEKLRTEAAAISPSHRGERLELPVANDELRRLGTTLNATIDRLEAAVDERHAFIASASHELRTPLTNLVAGLELGQRAGRSKAELEATIDEAAADAVRLVDLTEGLLDLTATQARPATLEPVHVATLVARTLADVASGSSEQVVVDVDDDLWLSGDPNQLRRLLGNLVTNATIHGKAPVEITAGLDGAEIVMAVTDQGPGIPASLGRQAFLPFVRADEAHQRPGAGLGLAIADRVVDAHGGRIDHGRHAGGHTVTVHLPRPIDAPPDHGPVAVSTADGAASRARS